MTCYDYCVLQINWLTLHASSVFYCVTSLEAGINQFYCRMLMYKLQPPMSSYLLLYNPLIDVILEYSQCPVLFLLVLVTKLHEYMF